MKAAQLALIIACCLLAPPLLFAFLSIPKSQHQLRESLPSGNELGPPGSLPAQLQTELQAAGYHRAIQEMWLELGVIVWSLVIMGLIIFAIFQMKKRS